MQMKKTHDAAMVLIERAYGARPRFELLRRDLARRPRGPDGRAALSQGLRRHHRQRPDRELLLLMLAAAAHPHSREAGWPTGSPPRKPRPSGEVDSAPAVAHRASRPGRRGDQQLRRLPGDLRRQAGSLLNPAPWSAQALPCNVDPNPTDKQRCRVPYRRADLHAAVRVLAISLRHAARQRRPHVRHVGAHHRSIRQRAHRGSAVRRSGRGRPVTPRRSIRTLVSSA